MVTSSGKPSRISSARATRLDAIFTDESSLSKGLVARDHEKGLAGTGLRIAAVSVVTTLVVLTLLTLADSASATPESEFDAAAAAAGKGIYNAHCASCHGIDGKGNGEVAQYLKVQPADLTRLRYAHAGEYPLDEVIAAIRGGTSVKGHGSREMPVWGVAFRSVEGGKSEEEAEEMVYRVAQYLWSIQK